MAGWEWSDRAGDGAARREMMWQNDAKVREEKGRWQQNKTGDATGRSKSKSEKGGCAGQKMVRQDETKVRAKKGRWTERDEDGTK